MNKKLLIAVAVAAVVIIGLWLMRGGPGEVAVDLIERLPQAEQRTTAPGTNFTVEDVTIEGESKRAILARPHSRLIYTVTVPRDGWLDTAFALKPESWDAPGDGAQFRVGISDGAPEGEYEELLRQYVNPKRGDRRWYNARLDLSAYEGRTMKIILNTDPGLPGGDDTQNDEAVWGEPRIYSGQ